MKKIILALLLTLLSLPVITCQATVSNGTNQVIYNGDGVTSIFNFSFNVYNSASENDLLVSELNTTTGAVTTLNLNTDYTVSITHAIPSPGTITLTAGALAVGTNLSILRELPLTQNVTEADNSATPASVRNNVYDRQVMVSQQLQQQLTRAVLQNIFATTSISLPAPVANFGLCWDATGTVLSNCATLTGTIPVPISNSNLQTLTSANLVNGSSLFGAATLTTLTTTGNVGIGTPAPSAGRLIVSGGNVGIGSITPGQSLDVKGTIRALGYIGIGGLFGSPVSQIIGTTYQAATDGIVEVACSNASSNVGLSCISDSSATPATVITLGGCNAAATGSGNCGCSMHVNKNNYYKVTVGGSTCTGTANMTFTPFGS